MRCLYRVRPYELVPGSADALHKQWRDRCVAALTDKRESCKKLCAGIVEDFDKLPIHKELRKPRVGIVGEILVMYMPLANIAAVDYDPGASEVNQLNRIKLMLSAAENASSAPA